MYVNEEFQSLNNLSSKRCYLNAWKLLNDIGQKSNQMIMGRLAREDLLYSLIVSLSDLLMHLYVRDIEIKHLKQLWYPCVLWFVVCGSLFGRVDYTVETLYSTIYYSKYFIELNFDKSTQYVALWTHKRHPHTFRASYGVSFMSTSTEIDRVIKGFYCNSIVWDGCRHKLLKHNVMPNSTWAY